MDNNWTKLRDMGLVGYYNINFYRREKRRSMLPRLLLLFFSHSDPAWATRKPSPEQPTLWVMLPITVPVLVQIFFVDRVFVITEISSKNFLCCNPCMIVCIEQNVRPRKCTCLTSSIWDLFFSAWSISSVTMETACSCASLWRSSLSLRRDRVAHLTVIHRIIIISASWKAKWRGRIHFQGTY